MSGYRADEYISIEDVFRVWWEATEGRPIRHQDLYAHLKAQNLSFRGESEFPNARQAVAALSKWIATCSPAEYNGHILVGHQWFKRHDIKWRDQRVYTFSKGAFSESVLKWPDCDDSEPDLERELLGYRNVEEKLGGSSASGFCLELYDSSLTRGPVHRHPDEIYPRYIADLALSGYVYDIVLSSWMNALELLSYCAPIADALRNADKECELRDHIDNHLKKHRDDRHCDLCQLGRER